MAEYPEIAARFARDTAKHQMAVLHEDGLYRHLKFADPAGGFYRFDIVTWPHNLFLRGDGFSFGFAIYPTEDMFDVFRGSRSGGINPGYWQEKVTAGQVKDWSEDRFRAWVLDEAAKAEAKHPGVVKAVGDQILNSDEHSLEFQGTAEYAVANFSHSTFRLRFPNDWEKDFQDWSWEFLFACHAVLFGIDMWDAAAGKAPVSQHFDKTPDPLDGCHWCACGNRWPCKHAGAVTA
ncbi:hypothetical protein ACFYVK_35010 [Streptomyces chartreusis]|uniref:hypothetical protein n=1 Tax=Streptomyces chartreusis TaxID=1969 RepID=UPI0036AD3096